jgi:SAM-dependent methyltransferase
MTLKDTGEILPEGFGTAFSTKNKSRKMLRTAITPFKYRNIRRLINPKKTIRILDVGCGHKSYEICKNYFNFNTIDGIDKEIWNGKEEDYQSFNQLYLFDLEKEVEKMGDIPDKHYDLILMSHVIEHLANGEEVIEKLLPKLSSNGVLYVETPSEKTLHYPSGIGFFNFHDDSTHKKIYHYRALSNLLIRNNCTVVKAGIRRDFYRIVFYSPLYLLWNLLYSLPFRSKWDVRGLWDFFGIAQFVLAKKK